MTHHPPVPHSADPGPAPALDWLGLDVLVVDGRYQRALSEKSEAAINRLVREFTWSRFGCLIVAGPDKVGDFHVIDGQHRLEAAKRHPMVDRVPCSVLPPGSMADEAKAFVGVNRDRVGITSLAMYHAAIAAGDDQALSIARVVDAAGVTIPKTPRNPLPPRSLACIGKLGQLVRRFGEDLTTAGLAALVEAYPDGEDGLRVQLVEATVRILGLHGDRLDRPRLVKTLAAQAPDWWREQARIYKDGFGGSVNDAAVTLIIRNYNRGLGADNRLPGLGGVYGEG